MLRQIAAAMHWHTKVQFDKISGLSMHLGVKLPASRSGVAYLNIDLARMQDPHTQPVAYTHDSISALPTQIYGQLKRFLVELEKDIVLNESAVAQLGNILDKFYESDSILHENHLGLPPFAPLKPETQFWFYDIFDLLTDLVIHFRHNFVFDALSTEFVASLPACLQPETINRLMQKFNEAYDYFSSDTIMQKATDLKVHKRNHENGIYTSDQRPMLDSVTLGHVNFMFVFCASFGSLSAIKPSFDRLVNRGVTLFRLNRTRYQAYCQLIDESIRTFFSNDEWFSRPGSRHKFPKPAGGLTLTQFLTKLFDPSSKKARIFLQSGKTESGKSFTASAWTALLFQLNGSVLGSKINGDFVRVSDLSSRYMKIIEEYKDNLPQEFYHLESNSKQLYSNNALIDPRLSLVLINCDKQPYSLDQEEHQYKQMLIQRGKTSEVAEADASSRRQQVESRIFLLNWGEPDKAEFRELSEQFKISNHALKLYFTNLQKHVPQIEISDWITMPVSHDEIILKWDNHLHREMRYTTLLDCWGDLGAWASVLFHSFQLMETGFISFNMGAGMDRPIRMAQQSDLLDVLRAGSEAYKAWEAASAGYDLQEVVDTLETALSDGSLVFNENN